MRCSTAVGSGAWSPSTRRRWCVRGLTVTGSGRDLSVEDSGIFVTARGAGAVIEDNRLEDNLIGVNLKGPTAAIVRHNRIEGRHDRADERARQWRQHLELAGLGGRGATRSASAATASSSSPAGTTCSATTAFATCASPCITCTPTKARSAATTRPATMSATPSCIRPASASRATAPTAIATTACC